MTYVAFIILLLWRLRQLTTPPPKGSPYRFYAFENSKYRNLRAFCSLAIFLLEVLSVFKFAVSSLNSSLGDIYAVGDTIVPFQAVAGALGSLAWLLGTLVLVIETKRFTFRGSWITRFLFLLALLSQAVKM